MTERRDPPESNHEDDEASARTPRVIDADELFQGEREICIELDGTRYRLRITRRNKLILQK